jgi:hypothetical protein
VRAVRISKLEKNKYYAIKFMFLWVASALVLFGVYKKPIYDYYFGTFFAMPFFYVAIAIQYIYTSSKIGKYIAFIAVSMLLVLNWQGRPFRYPGNNQLGQSKTIAKAVLDKTGGKPFNFALITSGNSDHAYRYFFEIWGHAPITIENDVHDPMRKTVTDQLLVVCEYPSCEPVGNSLWEIAGFGRAEIVGVWDVSVVKVFKLIHYKEM